jgi:hypothetical protein
VIGATSWQDRRAELLQQACNEISQLEREGLGVCRAIKRVAREFNQRALGGGRRLNLSEKTLQRVWYSWNASGKNPAIFALKYSANDRQIVDSLLLQMLLEQALQTGAPISEVVDSLNAGGAKIRLADVRRAFPKGCLVRFQRSLRKLTQHRNRLEKRFLAASTKWRRALLKSRTAFLRKLLDNDAKLERRMLRHREQLQRKFLESDARAVQTREKLQRSLLSGINARKASR